MAELGANTAIELSELPTWNSSFLIQMNFIWLPSISSITLGKFYSHWKLRVKKEPWNAKCRDWNINESQIFIVQIIFFPVVFVFSVHEKRWREVKFQFKAWEYILHTLYITFPQMGFKLSWNHGNAVEDICVVFFFFFFCLFLFFICSEFCHTLKWKGLGFTCLPHPDPPSHLPPHPLPPGPPRAPGPRACLMHPTWAGELCHPW